LDLGSALAAGAHRDLAALGFAASDEREGIVVQGDYGRYLGRTASTDEVAAWVAAFRHGLTNEEVVTDFVASDEYFQKTTS
jgi:hypothetical protein